MTSSSLTLLVWLEITWSIVILYLACLKTCILYHHKEVHHPQTVDTKRRLLVHGTLLKFCKLCLFDHQQNEWQVFWHSSGSSLLVA